MNHKMTTLTAGGGLPGSQSVRSTRSWGTSPRISTNTRTHCVSCWKAWVSRPIRAMPRARPTCRNFLNSGAVGLLGSKYQKVVNTVLNEIPLAHQFESSLAGRDREVNFVMAQEKAEESAGRL